ncbi:recombinase family protein [Lachnospiraceae bacterium 46-61]
MKKMVAIYVRVSQEDEKNGVSESIQNQISYLKQYLFQNDMVLYEVYCDDGFSGLNFERPAFQKMIQDIENGMINCVVVKDLSRLGRDYIGVGYFTEQYFPQKNIQLIAVNDNIDTENENIQQELIPFKALLNDFYAKDISKKIKASFHAKRQNGEFIGAFAPYGYQKDSHNKNHLIIDTYTSNVVQNIFMWYLQGENMSSIAQKLNDNGILSPAVYKMKHTYYQNANIKYGLWTQQTIKNILSNETYVGNITQGKTKKVNYKNKKLKKIPKQHWIVKQNTHKPIIDYSLFQNVQTMLNQKSKTQKTNQKTMHLLGGLLYCGDCGSSMTFRKNKKGDFILLCSRYARYGQCSRHQFYEHKCNDIILNALQIFTKNTPNCKQYHADISIDYLFYNKIFVIQMINKIQFFEQHNIIKMHIYWNFSAP